MESMTQSKAFEYALKHDGIDNDSLETAIDMLNNSGLRLEEYILTLENYPTEQWQMGGGCTVSAMTLDNGHIAVASDEAFTIYKDKDSFWNDMGEGEGCLLMTWLSDYSSFRFSN